MTREQFAEIIEKEKQITEDSRTLHSVGVDLFTAPVVDNHHYISKILWITLVGEDKWDRLCWWFYECEYGTKDAHSWDSYNTMTEWTEDYLYEYLFPLKPKN